MSEMVAISQEPWLGGWNVLLNGRRANLGATPFPLEVVHRGVAGHENYGVMIVDMMRTYHLALRWHISGDEAYARDAVMFLNAWSSTLKELGGNSNLFLSSGLYGTQWANAAELMRNYPGWAKDDIKRFQDMLLKVFYSRAHDFLTTHNGSEVRKVTHYWANWDLANLCAAYAIGVFCDRPDITAFAVNYYKTGRGTGASAHHVFYLHPGHLGQWQETHRDQGHSTLGIALAGCLCEMAWNQGEDLYGHWNNRLLAGAEYVARNNLTDPATMPFAPYTGVHGKGTAAAGTGSRRPCFERIYHHYVSRKGLSAPWTKAILGEMRPERIDGGDDPGMGTLLYTRSAAPPAPPSGLTAFLSEGKVLLSWWGSADATHYLVQRASSPGGSFTTLGQVTEPRTYTDAAAQGTWYYRIVAATPTGERIGKQTVRVAVPGELWLHLPLDGTANDVSGNARHGKLAGGATWGEGRLGGSALNLDGNDGHMALPDGVVSALGDFTVAVWVYSETTAFNTRIFDFGSTDVAYIALTPLGVGPAPESARRTYFMASRDQFWPEQPLFADALPTGRWVHVALTQSGKVASLYVAGRLAARHDGIWITPYQLGHTTQNWIGRSQYGGDRYFKGRLQDFRIYSGALTAAQVATLAQ
ncbi:hypothetical protein J2W49_003796 [Hydrogenophaga palleronii]|uniref:LamG-like jellyroll fold domain-containing protein n=1 Tax=Hydrogenophaga palleronii TaxID=65655 RepID=A0ABU1WR97_9BURK|nr:LamG-like jellyroll fold domain-containing protein [Hydrogenophaga palleronii]MDR7151820.1 hypothetical protein [Hydrogenophaga palleronii]